jgi:hypothetical protein
MDNKTLRLIEASTELITEALGCLRRETEASREKVAAGAAECQASWDQLKDDPEARAKLDASNAWCTSLGLKLRESAARYDEKLTAIETLTEALEG